MKRIIGLLILLISFFSSYSQVFVNRSGAAVTAQDDKLAAKNAFYLPRLNDTAFVSGALDSIGLLMYDRLRAKVWIRDTVLTGGHKWNGIGENISNASLIANGAYAQNWNNKQLYFDSIATYFQFKAGGIGSGGTRRKEFRIVWGGSSFGNNLDGFQMLASVRKADNSVDSLTLGLMSSGTGILSMGTYNVANSANNTFISYNANSGLINITAKDSIWIKGAVVAATADSILGIEDRGNGLGKLKKIPYTQTSLSNIGSGYRWVTTSNGQIKTVSASNTILWDSTSNSNALTAKADTSVLATQWDLIINRQNIDATLKVGNIDSATTMLFGYADSGFVQSFLPNGGVPIWSGHPMRIIPHYGSDTAIYWPRIWDIFKVQTIGYDLAANWPPQSILDVVTFGQESVGPPFLRFGGIEQDWYGGTECHVLEMKPFAEGTATRMIDATMNLNTGISSLFFRSNQTTINTRADEQIASFTQGITSLLAKNTLQPRYDFKLESTNATKGGFTIGINTDFQCFYDWDPYNYAFLTNINELPYANKWYSNRTVNSGDPEFWFAGAGRTSSNLIHQWSNGARILETLSASQNSKYVKAIGGLAYDDNLFLIRTTYGEGQKPFAIFEMKNDTIHKALFMTDTAYRIGINVPNAQQRYTSVLPLPRIEQLQVYGTTYISDTLKLGAYGANTITGTLASYLVATSTGSIVEQAASIIPLISTGTAAPATTPGKVGDIFVDTNNKKLYFATGTSSSADWTIAN